MKSAFYLMSWVRKRNTTLQSFQMLKLAMMPPFFFFSFPFFSIQFSLSCLPNHCKWFPSFLFKWHLQMRGTSGRQWIWNWKRHWTEDNATGAIISNPNDLKCHMMWKRCPAGCYAPYQCSIWFSDPPFTLMRWELTLFCSPANVFDVNPSKRSKLE